MDAEAGTALARIARAVNNAQAAAERADGKFGPAVELELVRIAAAQTTILAELAFLLLRAPATVDAGELKLPTLVPDADKQPTVDPAGCSVPVLRQLFEEWLEEHYRPGSTE